VQKYILLPRRHKHEQQKTHITKKELQSLCCCPKWLHCNQTPKEHHPQNGHHPPNSSPLSKSQMIRTMTMTNKVGPTTAALRITLCFYYFQLPRHTCYIHCGPITVTRGFAHRFQRYVESHKQSTSLRSLQPRHLFFIHIYGWERARQQRCLVHS